MRRAVPGSRYQVDVPGTAVQKQYHVPGAAGQHRRCTAVFVRAALRVYYIGIRGILGCRFVPTQAQGIGRGKGVLIEVESALTATTTELASPYEYI